MLACVLLPCQVLSLLAAVGDGVRAPERDGDDAARRRAARLAVWVGSCAALNLAALAYAALFTWGRRCGASRSPTVAVAGVQRA